MGEGRREVEAEGKYDQDTLDTSMKISKNKTMFHKKNRYGKALQSRVFP